MTTNALGPFLLVGLSLAGIAAVVVVIGLVRFRKAGISMDVWEFFTRLIRGRGFSQLEPSVLNRMLEEADPVPLMVDLREPGAFARGRIPGVIHRPFDDFLREVVAEERFEGHKDSDVVLICDTGQMSRVAGEILALDLGFTRVHNLRGGMKRWWSYESAMARRRVPRCCPNNLLPACCL
jgi:rhodanese-related sulfurtransferase